MPEPSLRSLEDSIKLLLKFGPFLFILVFDAPVFALVCQIRAKCSRGPEGHEPAPQFLNRDGEFGDIRWIFSEQVGGYQNSSCSTEQQATVYHLRKTNKNHFHISLWTLILFWGTSVSPKHTNAKKKHPVVLFIALVTLKAGVCEIVETKFWGTKAMPAALGGLTWAQYCKCWTKHGHQRANVVTVTVLMCWCLAGVILIRFIVSI